MNETPLMVKKYNGELERFSFFKLEKSLQKSGVSIKEIERIILTIKPLLYSGIASKEIYTRAYRLLKKTNRVSASKYSLKRAIFNLGPTGYPFEKLIAALLKEKGYQTQVGVTLPGACVTHEVDVVATKNGNTYAIECKFHANSSTISNVKVPLYINSRFLDIQQQWNKDNSKKTHLKQGWLITNTRFSEDAVNYGKCIGLSLLSWDYPKNKGIKDNISKYGLYPITALTSLTKKEKQLLIKNDIILTKEVATNFEKLINLGFKNLRANKIIKEAQTLCKL